MVDEYIIPRKNAKDVEIVANPDEYTFTYDKLRCREHNDTLYITAGGNSPDFNIYSPNYFASARTDLVETKMIDGKQCLVIEINDQVEVNGVPVRTVSIE